MMDDLQKWTDARREYEAVPLPPELEARLRRGIDQGKAARKRTRWLRRLGGCAACLGLLMCCLNLSPTIAQAAAELPVVGGLFEVLTIRNYAETNDDRTLTVAQPGVTGTDFAAQIDAEIQKRVDEKIAAGELRISQERDAFLATGGTEEEWSARDNRVSVDYEIYYQSENRVSFVLDTYVSTTAATQEQFFYNLDLAQNRELTLKDLLGDDWESICNSSIRAQMAASEDPSVYFAEDQGGFAGVDEATNFYINADGVPVVVFPKYAVAIGAMGIVEFEITQ